MDPGLGVCLYLGKRHEELVEDLRLFDLFTPGGLRGGFCSSRCLVIAPMILKLVD